MQFLATVRYGILKNTGSFYADVPEIKRGDTVVVRTNRGIELGEIINLLKTTTDDGKAEDRDVVMRVADEEDKKRQKKIQEEVVPNEFKYCLKKIKELKVPMRLAGMEHLFGTKKIIIYFTAESRVDFRELVKDIAGEYQARIEMKQIGVRDEARLLADYEHCGRELCCKAFLEGLEPVTMKMAKRQKATMDPSKISGRCGKLMCCLRYEDEVYEELKKNLPKKGTVVKTSKGTGEVVDYDILSRTVSVEIEERRRVTVHLSEITEQKDGVSQARPTRHEKCPRTGQNGCK